MLALSKKKSSPSVVTDFGISQEDINIKKPPKSSKVRGPQSKVSMSPMRKPNKSGTSGIGLMDVDDDDEGFDPSILEDDPFLDRQSYVEPFKNIYYNQGRLGPSE